MRASPERIFSRTELVRAQVETLRAPRPKHPHVFTIEWRGETWVVKDFRPASRLYRLVAGPIATARELRAVQALKGLPGVPADIFRIDAMALAYRYAPGESIRHMKRRGTRPEGPFFPQLEALVKRMHDRGRVHLDLRNARNVVVSPHHEPLLVDFQTSVGTRFLPRPLRRLCENVDLSGVYKLWLRLSPATFDEARAARFREIESSRKFWALLMGSRPRRRATELFDAGGSECKQSPSRPSTGRSTTRRREGSSRISARPWRSWARSSRAPSRSPNGSSRAS